MWSREFNTQVPTKQPLYEKLKHNLNNTNDDNKNEKIWTTNLYKTLIMSQALC